MCRLDCLDRTYDGSSLLGTVSRNDHLVELGCLRLELNVEVDLVSHLELLLRETDYLNDENT